MKFCECEVEMPYTTKEGRSGAQSKSQSRQKSCYQQSREDAKSGVGRRTSESSGESVQVVTGSKDQMWGSVPHR